MSADVLPRIADAVLIWCGIVVLASLGHALLYPLLQRCCGRVAPAQAADLRLLWSLMPAITASVVTLLVLNPELSAPLVPGHCHGLNCAPHLPTAGSPAALRVGLAGAAGTLALALAGVILYLVLRLQRQLRTLLMLSRPARTRRYRIIEGTRPVAWCVGWWRPQVYLSHALLELLNEGELQVVLEHEYEHQRRRDNLRMALLALATRLWPSAQRKRLRSDFCAATEMSCDQAALRATRDTDLVAGVIARLDREGAAPLPNPNRQFASGPAGERIAALSRSRQKTRHAAGVLAAMTAVWLLQIFATTGLAHISIELLY